MSSDLARTLRRLKPEKRRQPLRPRAASHLPFVDPASPLPRKLLYDTTVYVDILQGRFPADAEIALRSAEAWHSTVTEAELIALCGLLDPAHPATGSTLRPILAVIEHRPAHRTIAPDRETWREAGLLSGILARLQTYGKAERRRTLNDALLFASARKHGLTVLTRNTSDFDLLQQLDPTGRILFYQRS